MPSFKLVYPDGSSAASTKVRISFDGGGTADAISDGRGMVTVSGSNTRGKVFAKGREIYNGDLMRVAELAIR